MIEWLLSPIDPSRLHEVGFNVAWHGRLMVLAWAFLLPLGVIIARFFKIMPRQDWPREVDNLAWWRSHLYLQISGGVVVLVALLLILTNPGRVFHIHPHAVLGWTVVVFCLFQFIAGIYRGSKGGPTEVAADGSMHGDHYDMTTRRRIFEYFHKTVGYAAIVLAAVTIFTGLWGSNAPRWMWVGIALWWCVLAVVFIRLQAKGQTVDTYQAIWGPDPVHPGNHMKPIGPGIRRLNEEADE